MSPPTTVCESNSCLRASIVLSETVGKRIECTFLILFVCCTDQMVNANQRVKAVPGKE